MVRLSVFIGRYLELHDVSLHGLLRSFRFWHYDGVSFTVASFVGRSYSLKFDSFVYTFRFNNEIYPYPLSLTVEELMDFPLYVLPCASIADEFYILFPKK